MKWWLSYFLIFGLLFFLLPKFEYFPSQNAAYHAMMGRQLLGEIPQAPLLEHSYFGPGLVDQHLGLHYLVAAVLPFFDKPWEALRVIQIAFFALYFLMTLLLLRKNSIPSSVGIFIIGIGLAFADSFLNRIYYLRLESLMLACLASGIILSQNLQIWRKSILWYVLFFIAISFSWVNLILLFIPFFYFWKNPKKLFPHLGILIILTISSFFIRGQGTKSFFYFFDLIEFTMSGNSGIREWKPKTDYGSPEFIVSVISIGLGAILLFRDRFLSPITKHWLLVSILLFGLSLKFSRFGTLSYFFSFITGIIVLYRILASRISPKIVQGFFLVLGGWGIIKFSAERPEIFRRWNDEVHNYYHSIKQIEQLPEIPKRIIISHWEHWSFLSWHLPNISFEPGISTLIYQKKSPKVISCLEFFRSNRVDLDFFKVEACLHHLRAFFDTDLFLISSRSSKLIQFFKKHLVFGDILFENPDGMLLKIESTPFMERYFKAQKNDLLNKRSKLLSPASLIQKTGLLGSYDLYDKNRDWSLKSNANLLRSIMSAWVYCKTQQLDQTFCKQMLEKYQKYAGYRDHIGVQAMLGLLALAVGNESLVIEIQSRLVPDILPIGLFKSINYTNRERIFYPGEALLFLYKSLNVYSHPSILKLLEKAFHAYWFQFLSNSDLFYIRWVSELVSVRAKQLKIQDRLSLKVIKGRLERLWPNLCANFVAPGYDVSWAPLMLEGLSSLEDNQSTLLKNYYYFCTLGSLNLYPLSKQSEYYFVIYSGSSVVRDDVQAHAWNGVYCAEMGAFSCL